MIEERAIIIALQPIQELQTNNQQSIASLEIVRKTACGLCGQTRGCGNSIWGKLFSHKSVSFTAQNHINANVGDSVIVGIDESALLKSAGLLYILPLFTLFAGAIIASRLVASTAAPMLGALLGLLLGFLWVKGHIAGKTYYQNHQPQILRLDNLQHNLQQNEKIVQFN